jgi:hypothetical protein
VSVIVIDFITLDRVVSEVVAAILARQARAAR